MKSDSNLCYSKIRLPSILLSLDQLSILRLSLRRRIYHGQFMNTWKGHSFSISAWKMLYDFLATQLATSLQLRTVYAKVQSFLECQSSISVCILMNITQARNTLLLLLNLNYFLQWALMRNKLSAMPAYGILLTVFLSRKLYRKLTHLLLARTSSGNITYFYYSKNSQKESTS